MRRCENQAAYAIDSHPTATATASNAEAVVGLLNELGYPAGPALILQEIQRLNASDHAAVHVADISGGLAGVIGLHTAELIHCGAGLEESPLWL
jgi:hypothetical protein